MIEAQVGPDLQRLYFPIQPVCRFLTETSQLKFLDTVNRENNTKKILGLINKIHEFHDEMENLQKMKYRRCKITPNQLIWARDFSTIFAFLIGFIILGSYEYA